MVATLTDNTETRIESSITGTCTIDERPNTCTLLIMEQMGHEIILGMDILERLGLQLTQSGQPRHPSVAIDNGSVCTVGINELTTQERKSVDDFVAEEKRLFDTVSGPTHLTSYRMKLRDSTPLKQRYRPRNPAMQRTINEEVLFRFLVVFVYD